MDTDFGLFGLVVIVVLCPRSFVLFGFHVRFVLVDGDFVLVYVDCLQLDCCLGFFVVFVCLRVLEEGIIGYIVYGFCVHVGCDGCVIG